MLTEHYKYSYDDTVYVKQIYINIYVKQEVVTVPRDDLGVWCSSGGVKARPRGLLDAVPLVHA